MQHLPFSGPIHFARAPMLELDQTWQATVGILGVPFDIALGFRPGARFAPRAIREASLRFGLPPEGFYDLNLRRHRLKGLKLVDAGDVILPSLEPELARFRIEEAARQLRQHSLLPVFIGGDHSVSYPILRAFDDVPELHVVQFDAHLDFTDVRNDTRYSNSSPFRRACEDLPNLVHITTLGLRGLRFDPEAVEAAERRGHTLIPRQKVERAFDHLPKQRNVYISFDVDVFDPSVLPATSSPEVDGLDYCTVLSLISEVAQNNRLVGMDIVEFTPHLDPSGNSGLLMARLIMETLAEIFE